MINPAEPHWNPCASRKDNDGVLDNDQIVETVAEQHALTLFDVERGINGQSANSVCGRVRNCARPL
jgi:hypothetical protein